MAAKTTFKPASQETHSDIEDRHLTLGCEFECVLVQPNFEGRTAGAGVEVLKNIFSDDLTLRCARCPESFEWKLQFFDKANRKKPKDHADEALYWHVDLDRRHALTHEEELVLGYDARNLLIEDLEIKSRKSTLDVPPATSKDSCKSHGHVASYEEEIRAFLDRLNERLCRFNVKDVLNGDQKGFLFVNTKAGFHIHVGCKENQMPIPTLRRLCVMLLAWERRIDTLHSRSRISGTTLPTAKVEPVAKHDLRPFVVDPDVCNQPLSLFRTRVAYAQRYDLNTPRDKWTTEAPFRYDLDAWLELIWSARTLEDLRGLHQDDHKECTLNLYKLTWNADINPENLLQTIEFRQPAATLDAAAALSYIDLVTKMVLCCHYITTKDAKALFAPLATYRDIAFSCFTMLKELQCQKQTIKYFGDRCAGHTRTVEHLNSIKEQASVIKPNNVLIGLARLAIRNADDEKADENWATIQGRIREKLSKGGYGQLSDDQLEELLPEGTDSSTRMKLQLGHLPSS